MAQMNNEHHGLTRREAIILLGGAAAAATLAVTGCGSNTTTTPSTTPCALSPSLEEGPFFVDEKLNRSDLTTNSSNPLVTGGLPLTLAISVIDSSSCKAVQGAQVDIWHAHAAGKYSDESSEGTVGETYLRGYQITDANGLVTFKTIYPGWYPGRTIHIHAMIRTFAASGAQAFKYETQFFFDPATTLVVMKSSPYSSHGTPDTTNSNDGIYAASEGKTLVALTPAGTGSGYNGTITLGIEPG